MGNVKENYRYIGKGIIRAFLLSIILILIYAIITTFAELSTSITSMYILITSLLSVMYGTIYATRKIERKGWLIGVAVAIFYVLIIYVVSLAAGREVTLGTRDIIRALLAIAVGSLSGMLGINL